MVNLYYFADQEYYRGKKIPEYENPLTPFIPPSFVLQFF